MIETIVPRDKAHWLELRRKVISSTEVAALFDCSPYCSSFEIWHRKHDDLEVSIDPNERMTWGTRLEAAIAAGVAEDNKLEIRRMNEFIFDPEERIGASFDFAIGDDGILEIKNVDSLAFRDGWLVDGDNVQAPNHIECQIQTQLYVSGRKYAKLAALIGGNHVQVLDRRPDPSVIAAIKGRIKEFWESVGAHHEPRPDFARDSDFIARLYNFSEPGSVLNADEKISKLAYQYKQAAEEAKSAEEKKDAARAELLTLIGSAEKIVGPNFTISAGLVGPKLVEAYERKGYRSFRISWKKEKP